jgi:hypothetical protein
MIEQYAPINMSLMDHWITVEIKRVLKLGPMEGVFNGASMRSVLGGLALYCEDSPSESGVRARDNWHYERVYDTRVWHQ